MVRQNGNKSQIMLGTSVWRRRFGARADVVGETIQINSWINWPETGSRGYTVVGLLPESIGALPCSAWFRRGGVQFDSELPYCLPLDEAATLTREFRDTEVIGRLKQGVSLTQAEADLQLIAARIAQQFPDSNADWTVRVVPLHRHIFGQVGFMVTALFWASLAILAIGCGNAAHMVLVRFTRNLPNLAIRASLGASPARLAGQVVLESLVLVGLASLIALLLTTRCLSVLSNLAPPGIPRASAGRPAHSPPWAAVPGRLPRSAG